MKGFTECCISSTMDGTDGMWNGSEEGWNVRGDSKEDEDIDCADGKSDSEW